MNIRTLAPLFGLAFFASMNSYASLVYFTDLTAFNTSSTTTVIEDFESASIPHNTPLAVLNHNGITYTPYAGVPALNIWDASAGYTNFGTPATTSSVLTANGNEDFLMGFATARSAVGFDTYLNSYGPGTLQIFSAGGLMGTYILTQDYTQVGFFGVTSDADLITGVRWTTVNGGLVNTGIDNIRLGTLADSSPAVPEPSTLVLLALGAGMVILTLRRHRA